MEVAGGGWGAECKWKILVGSFANIEPRMSTGGLPSFYLRVHFERFWLDNVCPNWFSSLLYLLGGKVTFI